MSTRALYLHFEAGNDAHEFSLLMESADRLGYRVIDAGAYVLLTRQEPELWNRQKFPGHNPQDISCPLCDKPGRTSSDGTTWLCESGHYGKYEQAPGLTIEEDKWRPAWKP